jgi:Spy/CpxP family protein refolding chaperone
MKPNERKRVEKRVAEWAALTPEQRRLARANYRLAQQVARENVLAEWENYQAMTPEQRSVLGTAGSTSNTAARHAGAPNGLARVAAQPLPRRVPKPVVTDGNDPARVPVGSVTPTVGPAGATRP